MSDKQQKYYRQCLCDYCGGFEAEVDTANLEPFAAITLRDEPTVRRVCARCWIKTFDKVLGPLHKEIPFKKSSKRKK